MDTLVRINKALADAGVCSRRKAEELILQGLVRVNGEPVTNLGRKVNMAADTITVDGKPVAAAATRTYLLMHKPVRVMCTVKDPQGRPTIMDILPQRWRSVRLFPVGRLDFFSEGLLILTDDGPLAQLLAHPRHHLPKTYEVLVRGAVPVAALETMRRGMTLAEGEKLAPVEVQALPSSAWSWDKTPHARDTVLRMVLHQGVNRQIRRMCRDLNLTILRLIRVSQGPLQLGTLSAGGLRPLTDSELAILTRPALDAVHTK